MSSLDPSPDTLDLALERTAAFPFRRIVMATGSTRLGVFDDAVAHFTPETGTDPAWTDQQWSNARGRHRIDATGRADEDVAQVLSRLRRRDPDEIAVREVPGPLTAATLFAMAEVGCAVVCTVNVPTPELGMNFFAGASHWQAQPGHFMELNADLLDMNAARAKLAAKHAATIQHDTQAAKWAAFEDVAAQRKRMGKWMGKHTGALDAVVRAFARMRPNPDVAAEDIAPTSSYVGGYPFIPVPADGSTPDLWPSYEVGEDDGTEGTSWEDHRCAPMFFLCQINFAEVPPLPGYPTEGMLQWFVGGNDGTYGQTYDTPSAGFDGLHVRWYTADDLTLPALAAPSHPPLTGTHDDGTYEGPLEVTGPVAVSFTAEDGLPSSNEVFGIDASADPAVVKMSQQVMAHAEATDEYELYGNEGASAFGAGDRVGGYGYYVQNDPRESHPDRARSLLIQLDSEHGFFTMWGDYGTGQLFGDPEALATGDTSSLWWAWACY